ncbi:MAG: ParB/RepB/Spo0J family partition protein [Thermoanaerobaculia bacterium]|nr:ParB/RepB/Spo0J family partition protein [Thermoanaerobaculia bacterium]
MSSSKKRGLPSRVKMRHSSHFVEELTTRAPAEEPVGRRVPLSAVIPDPNQPRTSMGNLSELVGSVRDKGVLEPILVRPIPEGADLEETKASLMIISGERRYRAAMEAGLDQIPVIEMRVSEEEALEIALIENLQRKDLTPFEEAEGYKALADRFAYTHDQISKAVGKSRTVVTESFALLAIPPRVREAALALGILTKSILLEVLKADSEEEMIHILEQVSLKGLSRDDLRKQTRSNKTKSGVARKRPFVYSYKPADKRFSLSLKFRQASVSRGELIETLEGILQELRERAD